MMYVSKKCRGHFASLFDRTDPHSVATSITTRRKSKTKQKEEARKAQLAAEIQEITGTETQMIAKSVDGIGRRWYEAKLTIAD